MAHLICVRHGRRAVVVEPLENSKPYRVLHRGDAEKCGGKLVYKKVEVSALTVGLGMLSVHKPMPGSLFSLSSLAEYVSTNPRKTRRKKN